MKSWHERPQEIANLLNPAFCGEIIRRCITKYYQHTDKAFDYTLLYLILPIVLHGPTRKKFPPTVRTHMHVWLQEHQSVRIGFADRTKELVPITKESISFLMQLNAMKINNNGAITIFPYRNKALPGHRNEEIKDIMKKAERVGQWFSNSGTVATIYTMWGVKP